MNAPTGHNGVSKRPWWVNYLMAVLIQVALTAFLLALYPHFPLGKFPAPYAAALLVTVLVFGEGPAILAFVLSLFAFHYYFVPPYGFALPNNMDTWASVVAYVLVTGIVVLAVGVIQRGRRRAERLAESLQERSHTLDLAHVFVRDMDDVIVFWNRGCEMLYGFTEDDAVGQVSHELLRTVFSTPLGEINQELFRTGEWAGEIVHTKRDGTAINVATHWALHRDEDGNPIAVIEANNDISGRVQAQRALEKALRELAVVNEGLDSSQALLRAVTDGSPELIFLKDRDSRILLANPATLDAIGKPADQVVGKTDAEFYDDPEVGRAMMANDLRVMESGRTETIEETVPSPQGPRVFSSMKTPWRDAEGNVIGVLGVSRDITDQRRADQEREMTIEFLRLINANTGTSDMVEAAATFFQKESGCEAVGIRLKDGDDYPYYEARGFLDEFIAAESSLCSRDDSGCVIRDSQGYPICECMCGDIVQGRFDPSKPFFTEHGSFWTNCITEWLASSSESDRQARIRNRCNGEGYESMALIPLHVGEDRMGLLQLNDRREGMFSLEAIGLWERFADYLAVALAKLAAEEALRASEAHKRDFYRQTILAATEGKLVISERDEIDQIAGTPLCEWQIESIQDVGIVRVEATAAAREAGMDESRIYDFMACVVESTGNAAKHAKRGQAALYEQEGTLLFVVSDSGPGISAMRLPDVALTKGYTTAGTLGMGYKVMISFADKVYLATGPEGTTVALEMALHVDSDVPSHSPAGAI